MNGMARQPPQLCHPCFRSVWSFCSIHPKAIALQSEISAYQSPLDSITLSDVKRFVICAPRNAERTTLITMLVRTNPKPWAFRVSQESRY